MTKNIPHRLQQKYLLKLKNILNAAKGEDYIRNGTVTFGELLLLWTKLLAVVINDVQTLK